MKLNKLNKVSTATEPSQFLTARLAVESVGKSFTDFLKMYEFENEKELYENIKECVHSETIDIYLSQKINRDINIDAQVIYKRALNIRCKANGVEQFARSLSKELWFDYFAPRAREQRIKKMFHVEQSPKLFAQSVNELQAIYGFSDSDIKKIHFFIEMVKVGEHFPDSLRRMLYLYSEQKKTGKTTTAKIIASILNGYETTRHISEYSSDLSTEMQIGSYAVPKISEHRCVLMDECFYRDMDKTYNRFKQMLTSSNGEARLPYGQPFRWSGQRNYIATSNEPLTTFIKDWDDRRFLAVKFGKEPQKMAESEIFAIWSKFILNATPPKNFEDWSFEIQDIAEERGERSEFADDYTQMLKSVSFYEWVKSNSANWYVSRTANNNRCTFANIVNECVRITADNTLRQHRAEMLKAISNIFGEKDNIYQCWFFSEMRQELAKIHSDEQEQEITSAKHYQDTEKDEPF